MWQLTQVDDPQPCQCQIAHFLHQRDIANRVQSYSQGRMLADVAQNLPRGEQTLVVLVSGSVAYLHEIPELVGLMQRWQRAGFRALRSDKPFGGERRNIDRAKFGAQFYKQCGCHGG